jgi:starch phosphorylase
MADLRTRLTRLSQNLWWSWHHELALIFRAIDLDLWRRVNHNPIVFLQEVDDAALSEKEVDASILSQTAHAETKLRSYLESDQNWATWNAPGLSASPVAYFSAEFCIHESLPIYSGGLGVLAGDHLKSCSDLGIPAYGVSLLYRQGYFTQYIDAQGRQIEDYQDLDTTRVPLEPVRDKHGKRLTVRVRIGEGSVTLEVCRAMVGRCHLLLLDFRECTPEDCFPHPLRLYGGDQRTRIAHEIALGVGGYRALRRLGVSPGVIHMNEGHSAFVAFEAIAERMEKTGLSFDQVAPEIAESIVFTTHTPVESRRVTTGSTRRRSSAS